MCMYAPRFIIVLMLLLLIEPVPGGGEGPGGVLICAENYIYWKNQTHPEVAAAIPRRQHFPKDATVLITASATFKRKSTLFFLLQSELGDLYKVSLTWSDDRVTSISIMVWHDASNSTVIIRCRVLMLLLNHSTLIPFQLQMHCLFLQSDSYSLQLNQEISMSVCNC
jgi:hypothetical protein